MTIMLIHFYKRRDLARTPAYEGARACVQRSLRRLVSYHCAEFEQAGGGEEVIHCRVRKDRHAVAAPDAVAAQSQGYAARDEGNLTH